MQMKSETTKPVSRRLRPELTALPILDESRLRYRLQAKRWCARIMHLLTRAEVFGIENFPKEGPGLVVGNHLGDADVVFGLASLPYPIDGMAKVELYDLPIVGRLMDRYGFIWVHRGRPDRRAIRSVLQGLAEGRLIGIAPEGRQSVTGALEEGTGGAAYLALRADVPVIPVTFIGTEDRNVYGSFRRLRRPRMSMTVGPPFRLERLEDWRESVRLGTEKIMRALAAQLPPEYRGVYEK